MTRFLVLFGVMLFVGVRCAWGAGVDPAGVEFFEKRIRPVLVEKCYKCHSAEAKANKKLKGGLFLDTRDGVLRGGDNGAAVVPGKVEESLLIKAIRYTDPDLRMPPKGDKLAANVIGDFEKWVAMGAPDPRIGLTVKKGIDVEAGRKYWAFQPLARVTVPAVEDQGWCRTAVDRFVFAKQREKGLTPNGAAERRVLIRRAFFDLIGLPPTPGEVEAFVNDPAPDAWEKLIDRLLASPRYGERWARHWLDVARFAESYGFEQDTDRPFAYHFRDFVIKARNADMPYDQFVRWQVAGDEFAPQDPLAMMATGFLAAGAFPTQLTEKEFESARYGELDDMASTVGSAFLGMTVGCARCHDHKFDPIPTKDYYRLISAFTTTVGAVVDLDIDPGENAAAVKAWEGEHARLVAELKEFEREKLPAKLAEWAKDRAAVAEAVIVKSPLSEEVASALAVLRGGDLKELNEKQRAALLEWYRPLDSEWQRLNQAIEEHAKNKPKPKLTKVMVASEGVKPIPHLADGRGFPHFYPQTYFLSRGDVNQKQGVATEGFLQVLERGGKGEAYWEEKPPAGWRTSYRRRSLANWLTDAEYGAGQLAARVIVNRVWQHHFGRGIVGTPNDFGAQGERAVFPELLDWLAADFIDHGWKLKRLHKLMMTSGVYMQSSAYDAKRAAVDPLDVFLWRNLPRRIEAEPIRDSMLYVGGMLDERMYGPGTLDQGMNRRSIYFTVKRSQLIPMMMVLDWPEPLVSIGARPTTTIAPQALLFMNSPQARKYAEGFAKRLAGKSMPSAVEEGYLIAFGRKAAETEREGAMAFIERQEKSYQETRNAAAEPTAMADFCQALMSANEFVYIE